MTLVYLCGEKTRVDDQCPFVREAEDGAGSTTPTFSGGYGIRGGDLSRIPMPSPSRTLEETLPDPPGRSYQDPLQPLVAEDEGGALSKSETPSV